MVSLIICLPPPLRASVRPPILSAATASSIRPSSDYWSAATASRFRPVLRSWFRSAVSNGRPRRVLPGRVRLGASAAARGVAAGHRVRRGGEYGAPVRPAPPSDHGGADVAARTAWCGRPEQHGVAGRGVRRRQHVAAYDAASCEVAVLERRKAALVDKARGAAMVYRVERAAWGAYRCL